MLKSGSHIRTRFTFVAKFNSRHTLLHAVHLGQREEEHHQCRPPDTGEMPHPDLVEMLMSVPLISPPAVLVILPLWTCDGEDS